LKIYSQVKYLSFTYEGCRTGVNLRPDAEHMTCHRNRCGYCVVFPTNAGHVTTKSSDLDNQALPKKSQPTLFTLFKSHPIWSSIGYYLILTGMFLLPKPWVDGG